MLQRLLREIRSADHTLTLAALAERMETPISAIEPMVRTLERAGLLAPQSAVVPASCTTQCGGSCSPAACPMTVALPVPLAVSQTAMLR